MKKRKAKKRNPVAKFMERFNKPKTHRDKTKYSRKQKHSKVGYFKPELKLAHLENVF